MGVLLLCLLSVIGIGCLIPGDPPPSLGWATRGTTVFIERRARFLSLCDFFPQSGCDL